MYYGGITDGDTLLKMFGDFADLWERAAADGTPVRAIVGDDPVEFAETFAQAYTGKQWIDKERARLTKAIDDAERGGAANDHRRQPSACRAWRSRTRTCTCCAAWTSTWRGAASSPCSAPTAPARPRS